MSVIVTLRLGRNYFRDICSLSRSVNGVKRHADIMAEGADLDLIDLIDLILDRTFGGNWSRTHREVRLTFRDDAAAVSFMLKHVDFEH